MPSIFPTAFWQEYATTIGEPPNPNLPPIVSPTYMFLQPEQERPIVVTNQQALECVINWTLSGQWQYLGLAEQNFSTIVPASAVNYWVFSVLNNRGFDPGGRPVFDAYINGVWQIDAISGPTTRIHIRLR